MISKPRSGGMNSRDAVKSQAKVKSRKALRDTGFEGSKRIGQCWILSIEWQSVEHTLLTHFLSKMLRPLPTTFARSSYSRGYVAPTPGRAGGHAADINSILLRQENDLCKGVIVLIYWALVIHSPKPFWTKCSRMRQINSKVINMIRLKLDNINSTYYSAGTSPIILNLSKLSKRIPKRQVDKNHLILHRSASLKVLSLDLILDS